MTSPLPVASPSFKPLLDAAGATRSRLALGGGLAAILALALSFSFGNPDPIRAETGISMKAREVAKLKSLDEGTQAEILVTGDSAQSRNERIPFAKGALGSMAGFTIGQGSAQYGTALKCLTQAVYYEAANEPARGKRAVAQVILNRMRHPAYPATVCGVVYEGVNRPVCQFSFTCDGSLLRSPMARQWEQSRDVAKAALAGEVEPSVGTATHYHADYVLPRWAFTLGKVEKIGVHVFYRFPGSAGNQGAFTRRWAGREAIPQLDVGRMRAMLDANEVLTTATVPEYTPGLTVAPLVTDRHAPQDVGGRIDTTKTWRPSIPDPVKASSTYRATLTGQGEAITAPAKRAASRQAEAGPAAFAPAKVELKAEAGDSPK